MSNNRRPSGRAPVGPLLPAAVLLAMVLLVWPALALADGLQALRTFVREAASGRAVFTQTVTSPDGARRRVSSGTLEFQRPGRFRFQYAKPFEQLIVADGTRVWIHDPELSQATSRPLAQALGQTPAAILAGGSLERDFELSALPPEGGLEWAQALPRDKDGPIQSLRVGFRGQELAVLELRDSFGQRSRLELRDLRLNVPVTAGTFRFTPPPGTDVIEQ
jgi:outer membrane lipoprotein carrier protein